MVSIKFAGFGLRSFAMNHKHWQRLIDSKADSTSVYNWCTFMRELIEQFQGLPASVLGCLRLIIRTRGRQLCLWCNTHFASCFMGVEKLFSLKNGSRLCSTLPHSKSSLEEA
jgi:hypothetical protein